MRNDRGYVEVAGFELQESWGRSDLSDGATHGTQLLPEAMTELLAERRPRLIRIWLRPAFTAAEKEALLAQVGRMIDFVNGADAEDSISIASADAATFAALSPVDEADPANPKTAYAEHLKREAA